MPDRVWVKALVFRDGDLRRALVTADVLAFPPGFRDTVASALAADGWKPEELLLLASHTHTSIDMTALNPKNTFGIPQLGVFHPELRDRTIVRRRTSQAWHPHRGLKRSSRSRIQTRVGWTR